MSHVFRTVRDDEVESCYAVLTRVAIRLNQQRRRQRIAKTSLETYRSWQTAAVNYVVLAETQIHGIFSVPRAGFADWPAIGKTGQVRWLRALAIDPAHRHRQTGRFAVRAALQVAGPANPLFLDCVSGFLPDYYQSLGFETIATQSVEYGNEPRPYDITLLVHRNGARDWRAAS